MYLDESRKWKHKGNLPLCFFCGDNMKIKVKQIKQKKWTLYLYYNGVLIKKLKINENEAPGENNYSVNVWFKKELFRSNKVNIIVKPIRLLKNDEKKRRTYWGTTLETGIEI